MKKPPGNLVAILCSVGAILLILASIPCLFVVVPVVNTLRYASQVEQYLVNEIDHQAVAQACVRLLLETEQPDLNDIMYEGDDPSLPEAIAELEPRDVMVLPDEVIINKAGGMVGMGLSLKPSAGKPGWYDLAFAQYETSPIQYRWLCSVQADDESGGGSEQNDK